ncbi:MAG: hypothetical protein QGH39_11285 [Candidatus Thermoplasmatota archaeon]|nr:hypothetical protein [Candidatus Thermoplasmatota archaeon]
MVAKDIESLIEEGFTNVEDGKYKKAIKTFDKVIKQAPNNPLGYFGKAEASVGDTRLSLMDLSKLYRKATELEPQNDQYLSAYADFCLTNGLLDKGAELYEKVAELVPESSPAIYIDLAYGYYNYGMLFLQRQPGKEKEDIYRESFAYLKKGLGLGEGEAMAHLEKLVKFEENDKDGMLELSFGEKLFENEMKAIENNPQLGKLNAMCSNSKDPLTLLEFGQEFFFAGLPLTGEKYYLEAVGMDEEMGFEIYNDLASLLYMAGGEMVERGDIAEDETDEITAKSLYYSIRSMKLSASKLREMM